jgi:hypothetical protein
MLGSDKTDLEYEVKVPTVCYIFVGRAESEIILNILAATRKPVSGAIGLPANYLQITQRGRYITSLCKNIHLI